MTTRQPSALTEHHLSQRRTLRAGGLGADAVDSSRYQLSRVVKNIACSTLISQAADDSVADDAPDLYEAITAPKTLVSFTSAEGAGMHPESLTRTLYTQRVFDRLDQRLGVGE